METTFFLLLFLLVAATVTLSFWTDRRKQQAGSQAWQDFAQRHGLTYTKPSNMILRFQRKVPVYRNGKPAGEEIKEWKIQPSDCGIIMNEDKTFEMKNFWRGSGKSSVLYTSMLFRIPGIPEGIQVGPETVANQLGRLVGLQDIQSGDEEFDRTFSIKGQDEHRVKTYLNGRKQQVLMKMKDSPDLALEEEGLCCNRPGIVKDGHELDKLYQTMKELAAELHPHLPMQS